MLITIGATFARQAYLAIIVVIIYRYLNLLAKPKFLLLFILVMGAITWSINTYVPFVFDRLLEPFWNLFGFQEKIKVLSTSDRFGSINQSLNIISSNPLGIGHDEYLKITNGKSGEHNLFLSTIILYGLPVFGHFLLGLTRFFSY